MKSMYARHGIPDEVIADNMPFSIKEFHQFAKDWGFEVTTSSPRYPQSNGMSERAIQTIKKLLRKAFEDENDPYIALLEYRNTPVSGLKESPAQLLMGRMLKSKLPSTVSLLKPQVVHNAYDKLKERRDKQKMYYDHSVKRLPEIKPHATVRIRMGKTWEPATVTAQHAAPRSYVVSTPDGTAYRRNSRHLFLTNEPPVVSTGPPLDEAVIPPVSATPAVPVSNAESALPAANESSPLPTQAKCTSSGRIVRVPARYKDYVMN